MGGADLRVFMLVEVVEEAPASRARLKRPLAFHQGRFMCSWNLARMAVRNREI